MRCSGCAQKHRAGCGGAEQASPGAAGVGQMGAKNLVLESSHVPMLSHPDVVAEVIRTSGGVNLGLIH